MPKSKAGQTLSIWIDFPEDLLRAYVPTRSLYSRKNINSVCFREFPGKGVLGHSAPL